MKEAVITYLNGRLQETEYLSRILCLCEMVKQGEQTYPAQYKGKGQYAMVADFDKHDGTSYWVADGKETFRQNDTNTTGCGILYDISIPVKLIAVSRKVKGTDDEYSSDRLGDSLISSLTLNNAALKVALKAKKVQVLVESKSTDRTQILSDQFQGIEFKLPYTYSVVEIGLNILITTNSTCITTC